MKQEQVLRPVGEAGLLIELGDHIDRDCNAAVMALDRAINTAGIAGIVETVPAYASLLVVFDPDATDHGRVAEAIGSLSPSGAVELPMSPHRIAVDYGGASGPDLEAVAQACGLSCEAVVAAHLSVEYRVYIGGFAPGYAYMGDVPDPIRIARKPAPQAGHPPGSVIIAGGQCLITTLAMPTGWWVIGHTDANVFDPDAPDPFRLKPGDRVRFQRR